MSTHDDYARLINKTASLLDKGKLINEKDLRIDRQQLKSIIVALKERKGVDVLTINRGRQTIGWILASEVLGK